MIKNKTLLSDTNDIQTSTILKKVIVQMPAKKVQQSANPTVYLPETYDETPAEAIHRMRSHALNEIRITKKPEETTISTLTVLCKFNTSFNCGNIARYIELSTTGITSVTHGMINDTRTNRSLVTRKKGSRKKKQKNVFLNQVSMCVMIKAKSDKPVNAKIFSNGSIQMTGCKTIDNAIDVLLKLIPEFQKVKAIINYKRKKVIEKPFATVLQNVNVCGIRNFRVAMINSDFKVPFKVDRQKLYNLLVSEKYSCVYEPTNHACVNIKYVHPEKSISVFVFEKGSIIITGARTCEHILDAYNFINKYLLKNLKKIVKNETLSNSSIIKYLENTD